MSHQQEINKRTRRTCPVTSSTGAGKRYTKKQKRCSTTQLPCSNNRPLIRLQLKPLPLSMLDDIVDQNSSCCYLQTSWGNHESEQSHVTTRELLHLLWKDEDPITVTPTKTSPRWDDLDLHDLSSSSSSPPPLLLPLRTRLPVDVQTVWKSETIPKRILFPQLD